MVKCGFRHFMHFYRRLNVDRRLITWMRGKTHTAQRPRLVEFHVVRDIRSLRIPSTWPWVHEDL